MFDINAARNPANVLDACYIKLITVNVLEKDGHYNDLLIPDKCCDSSGLT